MQNVCLGFMFGFNVGLVLMYGAVQYGIVSIR